MLRPTRPAASQDDIREKLDQPEAKNEDQTSTEQNLGDRSISKGPGERVKLTSTKEILQDFTQNGDLVHEEDSGAVWSGGKFGDDIKELPITIKLAKKTE